MGFHVGIDFGNTNTTMAVVDKDGNAVVVKNGLGETATPTVVQITPEWNTVVGAPAKEALERGESGCMAHFKPYIGTDTTVHEQNGNTYTATGPLTLFFRHLLADSRQVLDGTVDGAVVTVPTRASHEYCDEMRAVVNRSGFRRVELLPGAMAAALAANTFDEKEQAVLVCDLGGTSLEVAALTTQTVRENDKEIYRATLLSGREANFGAEAWDDRVLAHVMSAACEKRGIATAELDEASLAEIRRQTRQIRLALDDQTETTVSFPVNEATVTLTVTREQFQSMTQELVNDTVRLVKTVAESFRHTADRRDPDHVVLVGGGVHLPAVYHALCQIFWEKIRQWEPALTAARGAARMAQLRQQGAVCEFIGQAGRNGGERVAVAPPPAAEEETRKAEVRADSAEGGTDKKMPNLFSFGLGKYNNGHWELEPLVKVSGEKPALVSRTYRTKKDNQDKLVFFTFAHTGGDDTVTCDLGDDIIPYPPNSQGEVRSLGKVTIPLPPDLPRDTIVKATFEIDSTSVRVRLVDMNTEETYHMHELKNSDNGLLYEVL